MISCRMKLLCLPLQLNGKTIAENKNAARFCKRAALEKCLTVDALFVGTFNH